MMSNRARYLFQPRLLFVGLSLVLIGQQGGSAAQAAAEREADPAMAYLQTVPTYPALAAATGSPRLAWVEQIGDSRQIRLVDRPGAAPRAVGPAETHGTIIDQLALSPDGRWLAARVGPPEGRTGLVDVSAQGRIDSRRIRLHNLDTGRVHLLDGSDAAGKPVFSPDSREIAFADGQEIRVLALGNRKMTAKIELNGSVGELQWAPVGRRIAFVDMRPAASFVGIQDLATGSLQWIEPQLGRDGAIAWSPDGRHLGFVRAREPVQIHRFASRREGLPWSILVAEADTGTIIRRWTARPGQGSALSQESSGLPISWMGSSDIAFLWEETGFQRLYALSIETGAVRPLGTAEGEVWDPVGTRDGSGVYFRANADRRETIDLWFHDNRSGQARRLTGGDVLWDATAPLAADGCLLIDAGSERMPRQPVRACGQSGELLALTPPAPGFPMPELGTTEVVALRASDGLEVKGLLHRPVGGGNGAALVYAHGGSRDIFTFGVSDFTFVRAAIARGYHVLAVNYRSGVGYGLAFREAEGYGGGGGKDVLDVVAAGSYLAALPGIDRGRIGVFGVSYGGYLTAGAMARAPEIWGGGAHIVGVGDWQMEMELDSGRPLPYRLSQRIAIEDLAHGSSANADLSKWRAPLLIISGGSDPEGWLEQAVELGYRLERQGVTVETLVEPGGLHGNEYPAQHRTRVKTLLDFFDRHMERPR